jgi:hypothetical protein
VDHERGFGVADPRVRADPIPIGASSAPLDSDPTRRASSGAGRPLGAHRGPCQGAAPLDGRRPGGEHDRRGPLNAGADPRRVEGEGRWHPGRARPRPPSRRLAVLQRAGDDGAAARAVDPIRGPMMVRIGRHVGQAGLRSHSRILAPGMFRESAPPTAPRNPGIRPACLCPFHVHGKWRLSLILLASSHGRSGAGASRSAGQPILPGFRPVDFPREFANSISIGTETGASPR